MKNKNKQTKFPVARIKKIMQKDEEVGKVAQATPIVISKALELFLGLIIDEASKVTVERGSKKVEAYHLKHAVETVEMLDFLRELVQSVPDPSAGGTIDLEAENAENKKKRSRGKRAPTISAGVAGERGSTSAPKRRRRKKGDIVSTEEVKSEPEPEPEAEQENEYDQDVDEGDDAVMKDTEADEEEEDMGFTASRAGRSDGRGAMASRDEEDEEEDKPYVPRR